MFIEIHMLQNHSPSNPNRDDIGAPKSAVFGGLPRARISSQCIKRSVRLSEEFREALQANLGQRTVSFPELVQERLKESAIPEEERPTIIAACAGIAKAEHDEKKETEEEGDDRPRTAQLIFLGPQEAAEFVQRLEHCRQEMKDDYDRFLKGYGEGKKAKEPNRKFWEHLQEAYKCNGVDIALFGRMTTSSAFQDVEAAMEVAHAISTTEFAPEVDYFTAVDDIPGRQGAAYLEEGQFNSALYYKYFSLDWDALLRNLAGDADLAERTLRAFVRAAAVTVPSGKRNSFGNNNLPDGILIEVKRQKIPTNYANAFLIPARPYTDNAGDHDVVADSIHKLGHYVSSVVSSYDIQSERFWMTTRPEVAFDGAVVLKNINELVDAAVKAVAPQEASHGNE